MTAIKAAEARKNLFKLLDDCILYNEEIKVVTKNGNVIMISEDELEDWRATAELCSIPGMKESLIEGMNTPIEECIDEEDLDKDDDK